MIPDEFGGFDLEQVRKKAEAAKAAGAKKPKAEPIAPAVDTGVVLDDLVFGPISVTKINQPDAVRFAEEYGILQSVGNAVYARKKFGDDASWNYQRTRTGAFYVVENGRVFVAFDDIADPVKNVVVRYAREGYDDNKEGKEFLIRSNLLESVLERAKDTKRFLEVPKNNVIEASVVGSPCDYEINPYFVAVLGKEMASVNAELLRNKKQTTGRLYLLSTETVRKHAIDGKAMVRPVGLGGDVYFNIINYVNAYDNFFINGCARGVRSAQKIQGGSQ